MSQVTSVLGLSLHGFYNDPKSARSQSALPQVSMTPIWRVTSLHRALNLASFASGDAYLSPGWVGFTCDLQFLKQQHVPNRNP